MWGSDWLHTLFEQKANYGNLRQTLDKWLPNAANRDQVLRATPTQLFRFA
jgi:predicted TIM-barrel fold metal-dependent hydrolase